MKGCGCSSNFPAVIQFQNLKLSVPAKNLSVIDVICNIDPECPANPVSWCKCEAVVSMNSVVVAAKQAPPPPLVVMSLSLKITVNPKTGTNEVGVVPWRGHMIMNSWVAG